MTPRRFASLLALLGLSGWGASGLGACSGKVETKSGSDGTDHSTGGTASSDEPAGAACTKSSECGSLTCLCGTCESACDGAVDCALPSGSRCLGDGLDTDAAAVTAAF